MSILPRKRAANVFTAISFLGRGKQSMEDTKTLSQADRDFLVNTFGDGIDKILELDTEEIQARLSSFIEFKGFSEEEDNEMEKEEKQEEEELSEDNEEETKSEDMEEEEEKEKSVPDSSDEEVSLSYQETLVKIHEDLHIKELSELLQTMHASLEVQAQQITELKEQLGSVEDTTKELKKSKDQEIAEAYAPTFWQNTFSPASSEKTTVSEDKADEVTKQQAGDAEPQSDFLSAILAPLNRTGNAGGFN